MTSPTTSIGKAGGLLTPTLISHTKLMERLRHKNVYNATAMSQQFDKKNHELPPSQWKLAQTIHTYSREKIASPISKQSRNNTKFKKYEV